MLVAEGGKADKGREGGQTVNNISTVAMAHPRHPPPLLLLILLQTGCLLSAVSGGGQEGSTFILTPLPFCIFLSETSWSQTLKYPHMCPCWGLPYIVYRVSA